MTTALVVRDRAAVPPTLWVRRRPVGRTVARLGEVYDVGVGAGTRAEGGADRAGAPFDRAGPAGAPLPAPRRRPDPRERHLIHEIAT